MLCILGGCVVRGSGASCVGSGCVCMSRCDRSSEHLYWSAACNGYKIRVKGFGFALAAFAQLWLLDDVKGGCLARAAQLRALVHSSMSPIADHAAFSALSVT